MEIREKIVIISSIVGGGLLLLLGINIGKNFYPQIKYQEKLVYQDKIIEVEKIVYKDRIVEVEKKDIEKKVDKKVHRDIVTTKLPDGTVITKKTVDSDTSKSEKEVVIKEVVKEVVVTKDRIVEVERKVEVEKKVEVLKRSDWMVSVGVGTEVFNISLTPTLPYISPLVVGGDVNRHIIGPFWLGVGFYSNGTALLKLSGEF